MTTLARSQETYWPVTLTSPLVAGDEVYPIAMTSISMHCSNHCDWQGFQTERRVSAVWRHQQMRGPLLADSVEKVLAAVGTKFLRAADAFKAVRHGGPRRLEQKLSAIFFFA